MRDGAEACTEKYCVCLNAGSCPPPKCLDKKCTLIKADLPGTGGNLQDCCREELDVSIYTRSEAGSKFSIVDSKSKKEIVPKVEIKRGGNVGSDMPIRKTLTETKLDGPISIKVKAESMAGRFATHNFLVCFSVYRK